MSGGNMFGTNVDIVKLNSKKYGKTIAYYNKELDRLGNGYIIRSMKRGKLLSGYMDLKKNIIIDLDEMAFNNYFTTNLGKDICLAYKMPNYVDRYFHIRNSGKHIKLVMQTDPESPLVVTRIKDANDYGLLSTSDKKPKMALYDYNLGLVTTGYLDHLEVINDSSIHRFYYEKDVEGIYEGEKITFTTLCGFLNEKCNFSSDIFDTESDNQVYDANLYRSTLTNEFQNLSCMLITQYIQQYNDKECTNGEIINTLYNNPVELTEVKDAKILKFNGKKV